MTTTVMHQVWEDLLFAHWPVERQCLQDLLPAGVEADVAEDSAWISVVPFAMSGIRPKGLPPIPGADRLLELNVRTYVKMGGKRGVYFFSLDANHRLAVWFANTFFHLNYRYARMACGREEAGGWFDYRSQVISLPVSHGSFSGRYRPLVGQLPPAMDGLGDWLTDRAWLFSQNRAGGWFEGKVVHAPWMLSAAEAELDPESLLAGHGLTVFGKPALLQYAARMPVEATWVTKVR